MPDLNTFAVIVFIIQTAHSIEELSTGFHKKWYLFKMPFWVFFTFEIIFELFWASVIFIPNFPAQNHLQAFFLILMFANGVQHLVWAGSVKKYVPGLVTAVIHCVVFLVFYFQVLFP